MTKAAYKTQHIELYMFMMSIVPNLIATYYYSKRDFLDKMIYETDGLEVLMMELCKIVNYNLLIWDI